MRIIDPQLVTAVGWISQSSKRSQTQKGPFSDSVDIIYKNR